MQASYAPALSLAVEVAQAAGAMLRAEFHRPGGPEGERGHAPIDEVVERHVRQRLRAAHPDWGYRGEETRPHERPRDAERHVWLVDPNDGTAAFIRGQRGSAVSVGLLRAGQPVLGVVYAPTAPDDAGDLIAWAEGCGPLQRNGAPIDTPAVSSELDAHTIALLSDGAERRPRDNLLALRPARYRGLPSIAYRLALAAAGEGDVAVSLHTPGDWDYGGGHALVRGAGGAFLNERGRPIGYAIDGESHTGYCFGGLADAAAALVSHPWNVVLRGQPPAWPDPTLPFDFLRLTRDQHIPDAGLLARAQGSLLGLVAGDSLGALVDGEDVAAIRARYPGGPRDLRDGGPYRSVAGQPVASERALVLARSIVEARRYDPQAVAQAFEWYESVASSGTVPAMPRSDETLLTAAAALGVYGCRLPAPTIAEQARGAAVRWPGIPDGARSVAWESCAALAIAIARAVRTGEAAADSLAVARAWAERSASASLRATLEAAARDPARGLDASAPPALQSLYNAFAQALAAPSLEEGAAWSTLSGGLASARAAAAGALLGALGGRDAVPLRWRRLVLSCRPAADPPVAPRPRPRPLWPTDLLVLAERLLLVGRTEA
jgi:fructose-1,6-bisphosphatase/inositol monophosphatase family enzyme/ADP-ribosylglycohydrolase